ncbi:unnamed protein product [Heterosigma akashiwo]|mmetsp:Transcript_12639/g.22527  ORF Transcript_12639/g.22527 Transcript_12639/m.22527 type:complete len:157 (-) Transcript_12639:67-537(-)
MEGKYEDDGEYKGSKASKDVESDDEAEVIQVNNIKEMPHTSRVGMGLDLTAADSKSNDDDFVEENKAERRQQTTVTVVFELPDGSTADKEFMLGQTVEFLKSYVEGEFDIPMGQQELLLNGKVLMDPMSLLDYSEINPNEEVFISVQGELGEESKK